RRSRGRARPRASATRLKPQHVLHAVKAGLALAGPQGGAHRAPRIKLPAGRLVREFDALAFAAEHHGVIADLAAAAQAGKADRARLARAGVSVATTRRHIAELDVAAPR